MRAATWDCGGDKIPGNDGYTLDFFKNNCGLVKDEVMRFIGDFHEKSTLIKALTSLFITLIPKVHNPQELTDFRPICLVGCLHKILSKLMASRIKRVIGKRISIKQSTFIKGKNILDGVLMLN